MMQSKGPTEDSGDQKRIWERKESLEEILFLCYNL